MWDAKYHNLTSLNVHQAHIGCYLTCYNTIFLCPMEVLATSALNFESTN